MSFAKKRTKVAPLKTVGPDREIETAAVDRKAELVIFITKTLATTRPALFNLRLTAID
jgi:hypothetical protein